MARQLRTGRRRGEAGFTLMELVVVLFIVALLAALAIPSVSRSLVRAQETALEQNLMVMRRAIDDFRADRAEWPADLTALVEARYINAVPEDPVTDEPVWAVSNADGESGITDVHSTSSEIGLNGVAYNQW